MRPPKDLLTVINGGWAVVKFCLDQYENGIALTSDEHDALLEVHLECCMRLAKVEDGPAILVTEPWITRSLRHVEESASNLLAALAEAQHGTGKEATNDR